jgi:hypothetical protein
MIYQSTITTPANTLLASPKKTLMNVSKGLVYKMEIVFPTGSAGLAGISIFDGSYQIWPSTLNEFFTGDDTVISFEDIYLKEAAPFEFTIFTYNLDDTYEHKIYVRIGFVTEDVFMARYLPEMSYQYFAKMLEDLQRKQTEAAAAQREAILLSPFDWLKEQIKG